MLMPFLNGLPSSLHSEATSECTEAGVPAAGAVVGEDGVLLLRSKSLHAWWRERGETKYGREVCDFVHVQKRVFLQQATVQENEQRGVVKESMYE
jgi:hypothetical protein